MNEETKRTIIWAIAFILITLIVLGTISYYNYLLSQRTPYEKCSDDCGFITNDNTLKNQCREDCKILIGVEK